MNMRKCLSIFILLTFFLTACGGAVTSTSVPTTEPGATEAETLPTATSEPQPTEAPEPVTLNVWFPGNNTTEIDLVTKELVPAFEEAYPHISVEVQYVDWGNISPQLNTAFAGGTAPDVFGHGPAAAAGFVAADRILPLDDELTQLDQKTLDDFGTILNSGKVNGQRYMVPLTAQGNLFAYRTDFFTEAGLDPAQPPQTWDELRAAAQKLTIKKGNAIERSGLMVLTKGAGLQQSFAMFLWQAGGDLVNADGTQVAFNSEAGVEALQFLVDLYTGPEAVTDTFGEDYGSLPAAEHPLVTGQAAIVLANAVQLGAIQNADPAIVEKIALIPQLKQDKAASFGGGGPGLFISKDSKHPKEAWLFIQYMMGAETLKIYTEVVGAIPARTSLKETEYVASHPYLTDFITALPSFSPNPNIPKWVQVRDVLVPELEAALLGAKTPEQALNDAATAADAVLAAE